ncbi:MAG: hypothetical protein AABX29_09620 [Nanoarchaeota archaeon]
MKKPNILDIILLVIMLILIFLFIWRLFGSSPSLEQIGLILTIFFGLITLESRLNDKQISKDLKNIHIVLLEIKEKIK